MSSYKEWYDSQPGTISFGPLKNSAWDFQQEKIDALTAGVEKLQKQVNTLQELNNKERAYSTHLEGCLEQIRKAIDPMDPAIMMMLIEKEIGHGTFTRALNGDK